MTVSEAMRAQLVNCVRAGGIGGPSKPNAGSNGLDNFGPSQEYAIAER